MCFFAIHNIMMSGMDRMDGWLEKLCNSMLRKYVKTERSKKKTSLHFFHVIELEFPINL